MLVSIEDASLRCHGQHFESKQSTLRQPPAWLLVGHTDILE